jgi:hypothetical protein
VQEISAEEYYHDIALEDEGPKPSCVALKDKARRLAIAYLLETKYNAEEDRSKCNDIAIDIHSCLSIPANSNIKQIFESVVACHEEGSYYEGARPVGDAKLGRKVIVGIDSPEAKIIADVYESGSSEALGALWVVNQYRKSTSQESLTITPVRTLIGALCPEYL